MPGYTHLQRAQPVTVGHHLLAWVEMLERDLARFAFARDAGGAVAARRRRARRLDAAAGAAGPALRNSLDAVADRDFALDYLYAVAVCFGHLSRIGEELCLWTSAEFGFARLPEEAATGSSMMPQKLNPDVAELARGKAGTAIGRLTGLLAVVKGLPLAYDRDLQEDKAPVFAARRDVAGRARRRWPCCVGGLELDRGAARSRRVRSAPARRPTPPRRSSARACRSATPTRRRRAGAGRNVRAAGAPRRASRPARRTWAPRSRPRGSGLG